MSRRNARKNAFLLLFSMDFHPAEEQEEVKELFYEDAERPATAEEKTFAEERIAGVETHLDQIDTLINRYAKRWDINRMNKVDLTILRLAVYELLYDLETPIGVSINEAVELAKEFSSDEAPSFINGILGKIAQNERKEA